MKNIALLIIILVLIQISVLGQKLKTDTVFILRENKTYYHAIFIEKNKKSRFYDELENQSMCQFDTAFYFEGIGYLKSNKTNFVKKTIGIEFKNWLPLYSYKGKYYVYSPSDGMYCNWIKISDSIFLYYAGGEMISNAIDKFQKINSGKFVFQVSDYHNKRSSIIIYIIDKLNGVALFEYPERAKEDRFELRVAINKIRNFPLVVNYCETDKQGEFEFDKIDFKKLIKKSSK